MQLVSYDEVRKAASNIQSLPSDEETYKICKEMEIVCNQEGGIGLAAVQVGLPYNFFIYNCPITKSYRYYLECTYTPYNEDKNVMTEGCLTLRNEDGSARWFKVERHLAIRFKGFLLMDQPKIYRCHLNIVVAGMKARVLQHESDHSLNIMICDIGKEETKETFS